MNRKGIRIGIIAAAVATAGLLSTVALNASAAPVAPQIPLIPIVMDVDILTPDRYSLVEFAFLNNSDVTLGGNQSYTFTFDLSGLPDGSIGHPQCAGIKEDPNHCEITANASWAPGQTITIGHPDSDIPQTIEISSQSTPIAEGFRVAVNAKATSGAPNPSRNLFYAGGN